MSDSASATVARPPAQVVSFYDRFARFYELWGRVVDGRARRRIVELCAIRDGDTVLDVATGTGAVLLPLARRTPNGRTIGVDLAEGMLVKARARAAGVPGVELLTASALELPLRDDSVDVATSAYMLDILPLEELRAAVRELARVLRPGGRLVVCNVTPGERRRHRLPELLYASPLPLTSNCRGIRALPLLEEAGFTGVRREYAAQLLMPSEIVLARAA